MAGRRGRTITTRMALFNLRDLLASLSGDQRVIGHRPRHEDDRPGAVGCAPDAGLALRQPEAGQADGQRDRDRRDRAEGGRLWPGRRPAAVDGRHRRPGRPGGAGLDARAVRRHRTACRAVGRTAVERRGEPVPDQRGRPDPRQTRARPSIARPPRGCCRRRWTRVGRKADMRCIRRIVVPCSALHRPQVKTSEDWGSAKGGRCPTANRDGGASRCRPRASPHDGQSAPARAPHLGHPI